jgi:hypothetical protein
MNPLFYPASVARGSDQQAESFTRAEMATEEEA